MRSADSSSAKALVRICGGCAPSQVRNSHVADICKSWEGLNAGTRIGYHGGLRKWLRYLGTHPDITDAIPHLRQPDAPSLVVGDAEFEAVLSLADNATALALLLARDAALRAGTIYKIRPSDVHPASNHIRTHTKWDGEIVVPMAPRLAGHVAYALSRSTGPDVPLLVTLGAPARSVDLAMRGRLRKAQLAAGAKHWSWHDLRRTAAQRLYVQSGSLHAVQSLLGHKGLTASLRYLNAARVPISLQQVAALAAPEGKQ